MKLNMNKSLLTAALLLPLTALQSAVKSNNLFSDNAVLQQGKPVPVWGTANNGEKVTVTFAGQKAETVAKGGKWKVILPALKASSMPKMLTITGENKVEIKNVLVGEVWVCSGQSNMGFRLKDAVNATEAVAAAGDPQLRLLNVPTLAKDVPPAEVAASWSECTSETAARFSAVAYFFGRDLRKALHVPVGLIHSSVGGTGAAEFTGPKGFESCPEMKLLLERYAQTVREFDPAKLAEANKKQAEKYQQDVAQAQADGKPKPRDPGPVFSPMENPHRPGGFYNGMIAPLQPYAIQGVIWYQGEADNVSSKQYQTLFPALIANWRGEWNQGEFPFLFVQIAPFRATLPELREAQLLTWKKTPMTAMAVTTDVGDATRKSQVSRGI